MLQNRREKNLQGSANVSHRCDVCGRCFTNKYAFKSHQTVHSGERQHQCKTCGRSFARSRGLKSHQMVHTGERPHACPVCGQKFAKSSTLKEHHRALHTNEKPYACVVCSKKFAASSSLYKHRRVHTNEAPCTYACEICPSKFLPKAIPDEAQAATCKRSVGGHLHRMRQKLQEHEISGAPLQMAQHGEGARMPTVPSQVHAKICSGEAFIDAQR